MATAARPTISRVRTVAIRVTDQDRALAFYVGTLGFETRMDAPMGPGQRWIEVAPAGGDTSIALVGGTAPASGPNTGIRLTTDDARAAHAALREAGADVDDEITPVPVPMFVLRDPDGNRLVLVEEPAGGG
jgi:predicted enzyme related to lactoylglutathione lyase